LSERQGQKRKEAKAAPSLGVYGRREESDPLIERAQQETAKKQAEAKKSVEFDPEYFS